MSCQLNGLPGWKRCWIRKNDLVNGWCVGLALLSWLAHDHDALLGGLLRLRDGLLRPRGSTLLRREGLGGDVLKAHPRGLWAREPSDGHHLSRGYLEILHWRCGDNTGSRRRHVLGGCYEDRVLRLAARRHLLRRSLNGLR